MSNYETLLKLFGDQLPNKRKMYVDILRSGSDVMKYATGSLMYKDLVANIQTKPRIPVLTNVKHIKNILENLQNETDRISRLYTELVSTTDIEKRSISIGW